MSHTTQQFIKHLHFDYIETYSFNRLPPALQSEYDLLSKQRQTRRLPPHEMKRFMELDQTHNGLEVLINEHVQFHPSSIKMSTIKNDDPDISHLKEILEMEIVEWLAMLCAPYYRDAIVFYNADGQIVAVLNVCLSCLHLNTGHEDLKADFEAFDLLKKLFLKKGHPVENPESFLMNQLGEQKAKWLAERKKRNAL